MTDLLSVMRAWMALHRGVPTLIAIALIGVAAAVYSDATVSVWGRDQLVPLWALMPCLATQVVATGLRNQVAGLLLPLEKLPQARAVWGAILMLALAAAVTPLAVIERDLGLIVAAVLLLGISMGVAVVWPPGGYLVGGVVALAVLSQPVTLMRLSTWDLRVMAPPFAVEVLFVMALAGLVAYVVLGDTAKTPQS